jgi:tetratricopeptide (TPR) repeat protein
MSAINVFISYSHDSQEHRERVLGLSERLRADGINSNLDQYVNGTPEQGWPRWMLDGLEAADFVLVICTQTYYQRFRGHEASGRGKGVNWEGALITQEIYGNHNRSVKFVPVLFQPSDEVFVPEPLRSHTNYQLVAESAYEALYDFLLGRAGVEPRAIGALHRKASRGSAKPVLCSDQPGDEPNIDVGRILAYKPPRLIGRKEYVRQLSRAWKAAQATTPGKPNIFTIVAWGGVGKSSLVAHWLACLATARWPGCEQAFGWSFYSQGTREQGNASGDLFVAEALRFFGDAGLAESPISAFEKGMRLAQLIQRRRALVVLDGLEPLQHPPGPLAGQVKDPAVTALLRQLALHNPGLCLVTSRESVTTLAAFHDTTAPELVLENLSDEDGAKYLEAILQPGPRSNLASVASTARDRREISQQVRGHALTLRILGNYILRALKDIRRWREIDYTQADRLHKTNPVDSASAYGHAFRTIAAYERWLAGGVDTARPLAILRMMGLFDRAAASGCVRALRSHPPIAGLTEDLVDISDDDWNVAVSFLQECSLLSRPSETLADPVTCPALDCHPLIREYFAQELRVHRADVWRAAHHRLYEYFRDTTMEGDEPTLEQLDPLYQAVWHACQAGLQQEACSEVYRPRINRGDLYYSTNVLGAFAIDLGAVASFFESRWTRVSQSLTAGDQAWMLNQAAYRLRALGRLREAAAPMKAGMELRIAHENWKPAAISASNLCELLLALGDVSGAVAAARQSVELADRSGDAGQATMRRATLADALYQAGQTAEAITCYQEAERLQRAWKPDAQFLYSFRGFQYCELLLAKAERFAWQNTLPKSPSVALNREQLVDRLDDLDRVALRAHRSIELEQSMPGTPIIDFALHNLTLAKVSLYRRILTGAKVTSPSEPASHIAQAVEGLRSAGDIPLIPLGLLISAWTRHVTGDTRRARENLEEAWEITEQGPMLLMQADILLYRARLFGRPRSDSRGGKLAEGHGDYPWGLVTDDLQEARRLIEKHNYGRRREEIADVDRVLLPDVHA